MVLQLANFELGNELAKYLFSRFGLKGSGKASSAPTPVATVSMGRFLARARAKQLIDSLLGHPLLDSQAFELKLETFLAAVATCSVEHVIVTSPTPCADPTAMHYRLKGAGLMRAAAIKHGWKFIDLTRLAPAEPQPLLGREMFFADAIHLGIAGQAAVGHCIFDALLEVTRRCSR